MVPGWDTFKSRVFVPFWNYAGMKEFEKLSIQQSFLGFTRPPKRKWNRKWQSVFFTACSGLVLPCP